MRSQLDHRHSHAAGQEPIHRPRRRVGAINGEAYQSVQSGHPRRCQHRIRGLPLAVALKKPLTAFLSVDYC